MKQIMKRNLFKTMVLVLFSMFFLGGQAFAAPAPYDDFSGPYIDGAKWSDREFVREVAGGKLVSKIGNAFGDGMFRNGTSFQNPNLIDTIECEITVVHTELDSGANPRSFARIDGFFYNTRASGGPTGDIWAAVSIGDRGSGLEAWWTVIEFLDDDLITYDVEGSGTVVDPGILTYGTAYTVKIEYDGNIGFTFNVKVGSATYEDLTSGPSRQRDPVKQYKGLVTGIDADGGSGTGYASATFDDVYINNQAAVYDDFSTAPLDHNRWLDLEFVREISGGKARLNVQAVNALTDASIYPTNQSTAYLKANVLVESGSEVSPGARAIARLAGWYYNDSRGPGSGQDYNGYEGDVWVDIRITLDDTHRLSASCYAIRYDTFDLSAYTFLFAQDFTTPIAFDTEYALSIEFTGSKLIFKCGGDEYQYDITTPTYPPSTGQHRQLRSRVYADAGESGYIKANFDDVYTGYTAQAIYDVTGTWDVTETDVWNSCDPNAQPETSTVTITQSGSDVTLVDEDGTTFIGTVNGTYYNLYAEESQPGETRKYYVTLTISSSTSGNGLYYWTWTDGVSWCEGAGLFTLTKQAGGGPAPAGGGGGGCFIDTAGSEFRR